RVDVILRKRAGRELDPLHVPGFGASGTPGLVDAARLGRVRLANALGTGLLQNRAIGPFADALGRAVLGEALALPDAPVRWLGDPAVRADILGNPAWRLSRMTARHDPGVLDLDMPTNERGAPLERRLARTGHRWVAEQALPLATAPCWRDGRLEPVHWAMRLFACIDGDRVHVLPGGLARLSAQSTAIGLPSGFGSKEVWITTPQDEPPMPALLSQRMTRVDLKRSARDLLSGTAEALFWLGRYTERAESALRTLRAVLVRLVEAGAARETAQLMLHLVRVHLDADPEGETAAARLANGIESVLHGTDTSHGLVQSLAAVQRNATLARGVLSQDSWTALNVLRTDRRWQQHGGPVLTQPPLALVDESIRLLVAFSGTAAEHMTRNDAWRFLDMGKRLERALQVADLVGHGVRPPADVDPEAALAGLLEICDSYMTYRSRYVTLPMPVPVLDLLVLDETNPRGLVYQVARLEEVMADLPAEGPYWAPARRTVLQVLTRLRLLDARDLASDGPDPATPTQLDEELTAIKAALETTSDQLGRAYFVLAETPTTTFSTRRVVPGA
ncbi:MAG: alpha-E domain-containing protein, partial [Pseudomonadota bacterium]